MKLRIVRNFAPALLFLSLAPFARDGSNIPMTVMIFMTLVVGIGAAIASMLDDASQNSVTRLVLSISLTLVTIAGLGALTSAVTAAIAPSMRGLSYAVMYPTLFFAIVGLTIGALYRQTGPVEYLVALFQPRILLDASLVLLPISISVVGAARLNSSGNPTVARIALFGDIIAVATLIFCAFKGKTRFLLPILYGVTVAILLSTSLRGDFVTGWDTNKEYFVASQVLNQQWMIPANHDAYASMLSITALPAALNAVTGISLLGFFKAFVPCVLGLVPIGLFSMLNSRFRSPGTSLVVSGGLVLASADFPQQLVQISRQALCLVLVLALLGTWLLELGSKRRFILSTLLLIGIAYFHYSTSYLVALIAFTAWAVTKAWPRIFKNYGEVTLVIPLSLVIVALATSIGWNNLITKNNALAKPTTSIKAVGPNFSLDTRHGIQPIKIVRKEIESTFTNLEQTVHPIPGADEIQLRDSAFPTLSDVSMGTSSMIRDFVQFFGTFVTVLEASSILIALWLVKKSRHQHALTPTLIGISIGGALPAALVRFSQTSAGFFNPERAALFVVIFISPLIVVAWDSLIIAGRRRFIAQLSVIMGTVLLMSMQLGLANLVLGGTPTLAIADYGRTVEHYSQRASEVATAKWIQSASRNNQIVQSDRYGRLILMAYPPSGTVIPFDVPQWTDRRAMVYFNHAQSKSHVSVASGRDDYALYRTPVNFFRRNFLIVYSSSDTEVFTGLR
jgi:uncharacterized membrane protein